MWARSCRFTGFEGGALVAENSGADRNVRSPFCGTPAVARKRWSVVRFTVSYRHLRFLVSQNRFLELGWLGVRYPAHLDTR